MSCDFTNTNLTSACCNNFLAFFRPRLIRLVCVAGHALQNHAVVSEALFVSALVGGHFIPVALFVFAAVLAGETGIHDAFFPCCCSYRRSASLNVSVSNSFGFGCSGFRPVSRNLAWPCAVIISSRFRLCLCISSKLGRS